MKVPQVLWPGLVSRKTTITFPHSPAVRTLGSSPGRLRLGAQAALEMAIEVAGPPPLIVHSRVIAIFPLEAWYLAPMSVRAFLSYSWDSENHKRWVRDLAVKLRDDGVESILDQWELVHGDRLPLFMEQAVRESDFVLVVCTPGYKHRSDRRSGGVGYEGDVMTGEVFTGASRRKFIPILRDDPGASIPSWLLGCMYADLRGHPATPEAYASLLETLQGRNELPPPIGSFPPKKS
jgi:hypothetical protein